MFRLFRILPAALGVAWSTAAWAALPVYGVQVKATYPHDRGAYTQGLLWLNGSLYESTGQVGKSNIRRVRLTDGAVLQSTPISPSMFGEGMVNWGDELITITWRDQVGFRWDLKTFAMKSSFNYPGEGWGLTRNASHIFMSDGTPVIRVLDPKTLKIVRRVTVTAEGKPVGALNELEWVKGEIFANIWQTNAIARINPNTGAVTGWIDLSVLPDGRNTRGGDAVLNGIAYDAQAGRLFVTGKLWPRLYEVTLIPPPKPAAKR